MNFSGISYKLKGKRFGRLVVLRRAPPRPRDKNAMWFCKCDCGEYAVVAASNLVHSTRSCGCLAKETAAVVMRQNSRPSKHDLSHSLEYATWSRMRSRCRNTNDPKYHRYGARGIKVCERWDVFLNFLADMGPKPGRGYSVERVNNDGDYRPDNCIWATAKTQSKNTSQNVRVTIDGVTLNLTDWCKELNIPRWRLTELYRPRRRKRKPNGPPRFNGPAEAMQHLYRILRPKS